MENVWGVSGFWECFIHDRGVGRIWGVGRKDGGRGLLHPWVSRAGLPWWGPRASGLSGWLFSWGYRAVDKLVWPGSTSPVMGQNTWSPLSPSLSIFLCKAACSLYVCAQLRPALRNSMDCSPPRSSVHGIFQTRVLEWVIIFSSRGSSWPSDRTCHLLHLLWEAQRSMLVMPIWRWGGLIWPGPGEAIKVNFLIGGLQASACQTQRVPGDLGNRQIQIQQVWGGAWDAAFPTSCPEKAAVLWTQGSKDDWVISGSKESTRNKRAFLDLTGPKRRTTLSFSNPSWYMYKINPLPRLKRAGGECCGLRLFSSFAPTFLTPLLRTRPSATRNGSSFNETLILQFLEGERDLKCLWTVRWKIAQSPKNKAHSYHSA